MATPSELLDNNYVQTSPARERELVDMYEGAFEGLLEPITRPKPPGEDRRGRSNVTVSSTHNQRPRQAYTRLAGADNLRGVTCYLDSLMFAMFARLSNFEPILYRTSHGDAAKDELALYLRLYVNMIRRGKLITTDVTRWLLAAIFRAGWAPAGQQFEQQDAAELFAFVTEALSMPLLALKVDIAHAGKPDANDDHALVNERLLLVPLPGTPQDPPITLEECLEMYFSNSVEVSRQIERRRVSEVSLASSTTAASAAGAASVASGSTVGPLHKRSRAFSLTMEFPRSSSMSAGIDGVIEEGGRPPALPRAHTFREGSPVSPSPAVHVHVPDSPGMRSSSSLGRASPSRQRSGSPAVSGSSVESPAAESPRGTSSVDAAPVPGPGPAAGSSGRTLEPFEQYLRRRADSDLSRASPPPSYSSLYENGEKPPPTPQGKNPLWTPRGEITLPAWMFLQLLPFYSGTGVPGPDGGQRPAEGPASVVAGHFANARPLLGICLKRYSWTANGQSIRNDRRVIVPRTIRMPSFVADDPDTEGNLFGQFKLVLESAVFHRGQSIHSGHFVSLVAEDADVYYDDDESSPAGSSRSTGSDEQHHHSMSGLFRSRSSRRSHRFRRSIRLSRSSERGNGSGGGREPDQSDGTLVTGAEGGRRWLLFDDLLPPDQKIQEVDFETVFAHEMPYLLFYRLAPLNDDDDDVSETDASSVHINAAEINAADESSLSGEGTLVGSPDLMPVDDAAAAGPVNKSGQDMLAVPAVPRRDSEISAESGTSDPSYSLRSSFETRENLFDSVRSSKNKNIFRIPGRRSRASSPRRSTDPPIPGPHDVLGTSPRHASTLGAFADPERRRSKLSGADPKRYRDEKCTIV